MTLFKAYTNKKEINYRKMLNKLELNLMEIDNDSDGAYMLLSSSKQINLKNLQRFKGIRKVYAFEEDEKERYFKYLIKPKRQISYEKIVKDFDLQLIEIGTSDKKNLWKENYPFMVFKSKNYLHPNQLTKYKGIKKIELISN